VGWTVTLDLDGQVVGQPEQSAANRIRVGEREFAISPDGPLELAIVSNYCR
jgi:hypothetical protein